MHMLRIQTVLCKVRYIMLKKIACRTETSREFLRSFNKSLCRYHVRYSDYGIMPKIRLHNIICWPLTCDFTSISFLIVQIALLPLCLEQLIVSDSLMCKVEFRDSTMFKVELYCVCVSVAVSRSLRMLQRG